MAPERIGPGLISLVAQWAVPENGPLRPRGIGATGTTETGTAWKSHLSPNPGIANCEGLRSCSLSVPQFPHESCVDIIGGGKGRKCHPPSHSHPLCSNWLSSSAPPLTQHPEEATSWTDKDAVDWSWTVDPLLSPTAPRQSTCSWHRLLPACSQQAVRCPGLLGRGVCLHRSVQLSGELPVHGPSCLP